MTTEKKSENTETPEASNKTVFAPLGKYAVIAVIMVSIIVTSAIMLDKQLNTIDQQLADAEQEVVDLYSTEIDTADTNSTATTAEVATTETPVITEAEATVSSNSEVVAATVATPVEEVPAAEVLVAQETPAVTTIVDETNHNTAQPKSAAQFELATAKSTAEDRQVRIEPYKAEHKKQLSEMFARIKALEAKQLDRYKTNQDEQIVRLREQVAQQQQMIEALVVRNKDSFELRSANVQRNQTNREQALNRI